MSSHWLALFLLQFLLAYADFTYSKVHYITPSLDSPCPQYASSCFTLSQFAANSSHNETDVSLLFLPGNHTLDQELLLANGHNFSMSKYAKSNETVYVECISHFGKFDISETTSVSINCLYFIDCSNTRISKVTWLTITDSTFQGVKYESTVLDINKVINTIIVRSQFLNNTLESYTNYNDSYTTLILQYLDFDETLDYVYHQQNTSSGALYMAFSNVSIVSCRFMYNRADIGGALVAHNSSVHIDKSTLSYNTANFGGAMVTFGSTVNIIYTVFTHNSALGDGGVMMTYNDRVRINSSTFSENVAYSYAGVASTFGDSSFKINNSNFFSNSAAEGGVVFSSGDSSFIISNSIFTSNSATFYGGVMDTPGNPSFNISNCSFTSNSASIHGGVMITSGDSSFSISNSNFTSNSATSSGGVMYTYGDSSFTISNSKFISNSAMHNGFGGVMATSGESSFNISNSNFSSNSATSSGGVMYTYGNPSFNISNCSFTSNSAAVYGGVMVTSGDSSFIISNCDFISNSATKTGGVMFTFGEPSFTISNTNFTYNSAVYWGGVMYNSVSASGDTSFNINKCDFVSNSATMGGVTFGDASFTISNSNFTSNRARFGNGGVIYASRKSSFTICYSNFSSNFATYGGGVMYINEDSSINISNSNFTSNSAYRGGFMYAEDSSFTISNGYFTYNIAHGVGGILQFAGGTLSINNIYFNSNTVKILGGGLIFISQCLINIANTTYDDNVGSIYTFNANLRFSGYLKFKNSTELITAGNESTKQESGVITSVQSTVFFTRGSTTHYSNNRARDGGAILAIESTIIMYGETTIANNNMTTIANSIGGGISLKQSRLEIRGKCNLVNNSAVRGGGIHATSSTIAVYQPGSLQLINNNAEYGGGMYLNVISKLYVLKTENKIESDSKSYFMNFTRNHANYGGAIYVADDTNSGTCSPDNECFIQTLALYTFNDIPPDTTNILFSENTATKQGSNLFGGLLDRCIPSPFAELYSKHYSGVIYFQSITENQNITKNAQIHSISSQPVRLCFCNIKHKPNCSYQLPTITVKKGEAFNVSVVAADQVNNTVDANITTSISSSDGGFGEGQQTQSVGRNCTDLMYNVFSPHDNETINLFADGPCGNAAFSTSHITIHFKECICPVGFEPFSNNKSSTRCVCVCDSNLSPYITDCNHATASVFRLGTNSWITYTNNSDSPGYVKYSYCPFDYCKPTTENVSINFNLPNGADTQCAYGRTEMLCGSCRDKLSLSLASSRCLSCHSHWPAVCVVVFLAAIIAGIVLVSALLALNMTVSVGLINGFIFYANIVSAGSAVFFPSSESSFPSVFVAWLNLEIGIEVCFINGLDAYIKTWLQLAFPVYIISLVVMVIKISEYSPKFTRLIGRKDPVSTLATLILLSYAKLFSVTITALSFAKLDYPNGKHEIVWLPDGNVKYFQGKHIPLVLVALLIILIGLPYTILLFLWQWIFYVPKWKVFKWTRNTKLIAFIATYHVPHNRKYRYWTGLLLLVRVVLYVTASVTMSANPQTFPLISIILIGGLFFFKGMGGFRVYKSSLVDIVDTVLYINLLALAAFSQYDFKVNPTKQTAVAYTSSIITFILFVGSICYHLKLLFKKEKPPQNLNEYPLASVQSANSEVSYTVIDPPKRDQDPLLNVDSDEPDISKNYHSKTP